MTKPKKATKPKTKKPKEKDEGLFPGKSIEEIVRALLKVPPKRKTKRAPASRAQDVG